MSAYEVLGAPDHSARCYQIWDKSKASGLSARVIARGKELYINLADMGGDQLTERPKDRGPGQQMERCQFNGVTDYGVDEARCAACLWLASQEEKRHVRRRAIARSVNELGRDFDIDAADILTMIEYSQSWYIKYLKISPAEKLWDGYPDVVARRRSEAEWGDLFRTTESALDQRRRESDRERLAIIAASQAQLEASDASGADRRLRATYVAKWDLEKKVAKWKVEWEAEQPIEADTSTQYVP